LLSDNLNFDQGSEIIEAIEIIGKTDKCEEEFTRNWSHQVSVMLIKLIVLSYLTFESQMFIICS
jgi:hypothetical protein